MDPSPARECSHSSCHNIIPATEAGIKQFRTCVNCCTRDATTRKRKRYEAKAIAAQQASSLGSEGVSAEASAGISTENGSTGQKRQKTTNPIIISEDSNDEHDNVSIIHITA